MPNWIEGTLKIRGKESDIIAFIENGLKPGTDRMDYDEYFIAAYTYVDNSSRMFVSDDCEIFLSEGIDNIYYLPIKQAWGFEPNDFIYISKTYNLDLRITGFEKGMGFEQEIEVINGEVTINRSNNYNDYWWECPCPTLGG